MISRNVNTKGILRGAEFVAFVAIVAGRPDMHGLDVHEDPDPDLVGVAACDAVPAIPPPTQLLQQIIPL